MAVTIVLEIEHNSFSIYLEVGLVIFWCCDYVYHVAKDTFMFHLVKLAGEGQGGE